MPHSDPTKARAYHREYNKRWRQANPEADRTKQKKWRDANKEKQTVYNRAKNLRLNYGMTIEEYEVLYRFVGGKCQVCQTPKDRLAVDHCHETGRVRGLLCAKCNTGIGKLGDTADNVMRAVEYLRRG